MILNGFIYAFFGLAILGVMAFIIFGGIEKLGEKFPKIQDFLENMFSSKEE
ncbi:MAG: hypothetical protein J1F35_08585 [Erysipelotrichales bacterium]|nr:hypothetical protein [Erysipelotrichales bacterium]